MSGKVKTASKGETTPQEGPRGGTTTRTKSGHVKKNLWIDPDDAEWLRKVAFEEHLTEASIIRLGLKMVRKQHERTGEWPKA